MERPVWSQICARQVAIINGNKNYFNVKDFISACKKCECGGARKYFSKRISGKYVNNILRFLKEVKVYMIKNIQLNLYYCRNEVDLQFCNNQLTEDSLKKLKWIKFDFNKLNIVLICKCESLS